MPYTNAKTPLRDVLYAFSMTKPIPDAELLDQFIRRYPEYRAALIEFATDVAIDNLRGDDDALPENAATTVSPAVARAMSRLQNQLYAVRQIKARSAESKSLAVVENPFAITGSGRGRDGQMPANRVRRPPMESKRKAALCVNQQALDRLALALFAADGTLTLERAYQMAMDEMEARENAKGPIPTA